MTPAASPATSQSPGRPRPVRTATATGVALRLPVVLALLLAGCVLLAGCGTTATTSSPGAGTATAGSGASTAGSGATPGSADANGCPTSNTTPFAKTKFVLHTGLAFGTFHRYIYKPYTNHQFSSGAHGRVLALVKAGATALFDKREIRLAVQDVKANPTLCRVLAAPLGQLSDSLTGLENKVKSGDLSAVSAVESQIAGIGSASAKNGTSITESTNQSAG